MTQKQSVNSKQTPGVKQEVKVVIGDSVLLKAGRRKKAGRKKKATKKPGKQSEWKPVQPTVPTGTKSQTFGFGNQLFASPPQFLRPSPSPIEPIQPARKEPEIAPSRPLERKTTEPLPPFTERRGTPIPEPIRSFVIPQQASQSLADMIRKQATESPVPVIRVPSFRIRSPSDTSSAPNQANQPSVDVSMPDPAPPAPQAPAGAPFVAAQPAYVGQSSYSPVVVRPFEIGGIRGFEVDGDMFGGGNITFAPARSERRGFRVDSDVESDASEYNPDYDRD